MGRGEEIESAAVEEDSGSVVKGVTEATHLAFQAALWQSAAPPHRCLVVSIFPIRGSKNIFSNYLHL